MSDLPSPALPPPAPPPPRPPAFPGHEHRPLSPDPKHVSPAVPVLVALLSAAAGLAVLAASKNALVERSAHSKHLLVQLAVFAVAGAGWAVAPPGPRRELRALLGAAAGSGVAVAGTLLLGSTERHATAVADEVFSGSSLGRALLWALITAAAWAVTIGAGTPTIGMARAAAGAAFGGAATGATMGLLAGTFVFGGAAYGTDLWWSQPFENTGGVVRAVPLLFLATLVPIVLAATAATTRPPATPRPPTRPTPPTVPASVDPGCPVLVKAEISGSNERVQQARTEILFGRPTRPGRAPVLEGGGKVSCAPPGAAVIPFYVTSTPTSRGGPHKVSLRWSQSISGRADVTRFPMTIEFHDFNGTRCEPATSSDVDRTSAVYEWPSLARGEDGAGNGYLIIPGYWNAQGRAVGRSSALLSVIPVINDLFTTNTFILTGGEITRFKDPATGDTYGVMHVVR